MPTATPQVLRALPGYVLDRNGPAVLRLRHAPRALPWLWRFIRAGRPSEVARIATTVALLDRGRLIRLGPAAEVLSDPAFAGRGREAGALIADTDLRTGITPAVLIGQGVSAVTLWGGLGGLALTGAIAWRRRTPAVA